MFNLNRSQSIGHYGEWLALEQLKDRGHNARFCPDFRESGVDIRVDNLPVEVKFSHPTKRVWRHIGYTRWQWLIHPSSQKLTEEYALILIAQTAPDENHFFILPGSTVGERTQIQITSHPLKYRGWLAQWLNRWDLISYLQNGIYRNGGPLFHLMGVN